MSIWNGVYRSFQEAQGDADVFGSAIWLDKIADRAKTSVQDHETGGLLPHSTTSSDYILGPLAAISAEPGKRLTILDFGGGMATSFYPVVDALDADCDVSFHVVENAALCRLAPKVLRDDPRLFFHTELPDLAEGCDIVHAGSSLHYVEDWHSLIRRFAAYSPELMIFAELPADDIEETFVTLQNFHGQQIPVWFFRLPEFVEVVAESGYRIVYKARYNRDVRTREAAPPVETLPPSHRIGGFCQLMFRRQ